MEKSQTKYIFAVLDVHSPQYRCWNNFHFWYTQIEFAICVIIVFRDVMILLIIFSVNLESGYATQKTFQQIHIQTTAKRFVFSLTWTGVCHRNMLSYKIPYLWFSTVIGLLYQNKPNLWCYCIFSSWWRACSHYVLMRKRTLSSSFFSLIAMCCDSSVFGMTVTG